MENKPCILVVDDDPVTLRVLQELIERTGYQVVLVENSQTALQFAREQTFAAVITDYAMPEMLGPELLQQIAKLQPDASRIVMTGMPSLEAVLRAVNEGDIFRFVTKPWVSAEMSATIRSAIERYELLTTNQHLLVEKKILEEKLHTSDYELEKKDKEVEIQKRLLAESRIALTDSFHRSLELCRRILNTFNPLLAAQAKLTAELCGNLIKEGDFTEEEKHALEVSARLYDLGLTGVAPELLPAIQNEKKPFTKELEWIAHNHPIYGQTLAAFVDTNKQVSDTIRSHHEHYDGTGYPDALLAEEIPWTARCLAVVVAYVIKVSGGLTHEDAISELLQESEKIFDPQAIQLFLKCIVHSPSHENLQDVRLEDLRPGMQLAKDFATPDGLILYTRGQRLDEPAIAQLRQQFFLHVITPHLTVFG